MSRLTICVTRTDPWTGSGSSSRGWISARRGMALGLLRSVLRASLAALADPGRVEPAADDLVAEAGKILHAATAHEHDRVLLEVVPLARDVRADLHRVREPDARDLAQRGVRLLRRGRVDARADAALLRRSPEGGCLGLGARALSALADELVHGGHALLLRRSVAGFTERTAGTRCPPNRPQDGSKRAAKGLRVVLSAAYIEAALHGRLGWTRSSSCSQPPRQRSPSPRRPSRCGRRRRLGATGPRSMRSSRSWARSPSASPGRSSVPARERRRRPRRPIPGSTS